MILANGLTLMPHSASNFSGQYDALFLFLLGVSAFFAIIICSLIVYFSLRYRRRHPTDAPPRVPSNTTLEIAWMVFPFLILLVMFLWGAKLFVDMRSPPPDAIQINVVAKQWMWKTEHPNGTREINCLTIPANRPIKLQMRSEDVIHSFFVPAFRIKQDVLPGRYTQQWFTATKPGTYPLYCAEYCGTNHSQMRGEIVVLTPAEYEAWLAGTSADVAPAVSGAKLFKLYGCTQCHGAIAPTLSGLYRSQVLLSDGSHVTADDNYLRESILLPQAKLVSGYGPIMPSFRDRMTEEQVDDLVAYIKSIGPGAGAVEKRAAASQPVNEPPPAPRRSPP